MKRRNGTKLLPEWRGLPVSGTNLKEDTARIKTTKEKARVLRVQYLQCFPFATQRVDRFLEKKGGTENCFASR